MQTSPTGNGASWTPYELAGTLLNPNTMLYLQSVIVANAVLRNRGGELL
ncbi:MAG: hypothetical protein GY953_35630, partial [bacterium]|nr:hypothetical protein [bacterium]